MLKIYLTKAFFIFAAIFILPSQLFSQKYPMKFGKISKDNLEMTVYPNDTVAEAVVLCDFGISQIRFVKDKGFVLEFTNHTKIKILKKEGLSLANIKVRLYSARTNVDEDLNSLKAQTYNLENGKIVTSKLSRKDVFVEDQSKHWKVKKFALPNVKVGSIIEYKYTITSDFFYIKPWYFQSSIPVVWSEYRTIIPEYFEFKRFFGRYMSPDISESNSSTQSDVAIGSYVVNTNRYVFKNIPAFRNEDFITTPNDYLAKVEFEHLSTRIPGQGYKSFTSSWDQICHKLISRDDFGGALNHHGIVKDLSEQISNEGSDMQKATDACNAINKSIKWNGHSGIYVENTLRSAFNDGEGNIAEINLLLINLFRAVGLESHPVLLSTRSNGVVNKYFPKQSSFNYVVALAKIDGKSVLFDASRDFIKPGNLPFNCINGEGLIVTNGATQWINLRSSEQFKRNTTILMNINDDGLNATISKNISGLSALSLRNSIAQDGKEKFIEDYIDNKEDWVIDSIKINNEKEVTKPVKENIYISEFSNIDTESELVYIPAVLTANEMDNPFTDETRMYPVDFGIPMNTTYFLNFKIPKEYNVEETPENSMAVLPDKAAQFVYKTLVNNGYLQTYCNIKINKTFFLPEEYELLKEFYSHIIEKINEQVVLKKQ